MGRKGKVEVLVWFLIVVALGLYRNLGVPVFRFWPLILIDTLLRIPGDNILKLIRPGWPVIAQEILCGLLQLGTALLVWRGFRILKPVRRGDPPVGAAALSQEESPQAQAKRIRKKRLTVAAWIAFVLLIVNGRCGRGAVYLISFCCGVHGYPVRVATEVSVHTEAGTGLKTTWTRRPPMLFFFENADELRRHADLTKDLWGLTAKPWTSMMAMRFDSTSSPKELEERGKELTDTSARKGLPASPQRGFYKGGNEPKVIGANFDLLLNKAGGGWWRERAGGFVVSVNTAVPEGGLLERSYPRLPATVIHAEDVEDACLFLRGLTGLEIVNMVGETGRAVAEGPLIEFAEELDEVHIQVGHEHSWGELVEEIATSRRFFVDDEDGRLVVRDIRKNEVGSRVKQLFEERRSATGWSSPDRSLGQFPRDSAAYVAAYLDDADDDIVRYAIRVFAVLGVEAVRSQLLDMLVTGTTKSGRTISDGTREDAADILMKAGERAALSYLKESKRLDREHVEYWYQDPVNVVPTLGAVDIQDELRALFKAQRPLVRPGKLHVRGLPGNIPRAEAAAVERLALDVLNAFSISYWDEDATATLKFSPDGLTAKYSVELSHYWGPLAAGGNSYLLDLVNIGGRWLVTRIWPGGFWIS